MMKTTGDNRIYTALYHLYKVKSMQNNTTCDLGIFTRPCVGIINTKVRTVITGERGSKEMKV